MHPGKGVSQRLPGFSFPKPLDPSPGDRTLLPSAGTPLFIPVLAVFVPYMVRFGINGLAVRAEHLQKENTVKKQM